MPAFTFEKLSPPVCTEAASPNVPVARRSALMRFLDRFASARPHTSETATHKVQRLKIKYRKQRASL